MEARHGVDTHDFVLFDAAEVADLAAMEATSPILVPLLFQLFVALVVGLDDLGPGPEDVHEGVDPEHVLHSPADKPDNIVEQLTIRDLGTCIRRIPQANRVDQIICDLKGKSQYTVPQLLEEFVFLQGVHGCLVFSLRLVGHDSGSDEQASQDEDHRDRYHHYVEGYVNAGLATGVDRVLFHGIVRCDANKHLDQENYEVHGEIAAAQYHQSFQVDFLLG